MSANSQAAKIGLDARAAELKEKLLRSRSQNQARLNSTQPSTPSTPNPARTSTHPPALALSLPASNDPSAEPAQPSVIPRISHYGTPRQAPVASLPADANDIAALISSISSAAENPGLDINATLGSNTPKQPAEPATTANAQALSPAKPPSKTAIAMPTPRPVSVQATQSQNAPMAVAETPTKEQTENAPPKSREMTIPEKEEGPTSVNSASPATVSRANTIQAAISSNHRQDSLGKQTEGTLTEPYHDSAQQDTRTKPPTTPTLNPEAGGSVTALKKVKNNVGGKAVIGGKDANQKLPNPLPQPESSDDATTRLLAQVPDLKDWLELTDYYNVEIRTRKLDRFRRVRALAAEKLRIEEEERKLMEEEELEMGLQRSTVARLTRASSTLSVGPERAISSLPTTIIPLAAGETKGGAPAVPAKRSHEVDGDDTREEKMPRLGEATTGLESTDNRVPETQKREERPEDNRRDSQPDRLDSRPKRPSRDSTPHRRPHTLSSPRRWSPTSRSRDQSPHRHSRSGARFRPDYDALDDRSWKFESYKYSSYRPSSPRRRDSGSHVTYPLRVDLGRRGDTRFFIVKSFNEENVRQCMEDNLWITQTQNVQTLTSAFAKCKNVILFFSINKSRAFQGWARMVSAPSPDTPRPRWVKGIHWEVSDPFRVQWLCKTTVEFWRIGHLKNPYNNDLPVLVGKDGQEIEGSCGTELLREMEAYVESLGGKDHHHHHESSRGGWGYGGGGRGGSWGNEGKYIKREASIERR
ncbi:hypothetical protein VTK26DRAFT_152 [Humicola hyalothermophila]